ncbi:MAG: hypothetical protein M1834_002328 [Cirrosporium novae-zelandiae]|nr:MAG: hypothetical protein M1834_002328 [Cirrosporium novae-zelandiae]
MVDKLSHFPANQTLRLPTSVDKYRERQELQDTTTTTKSTTATSINSLHAGAKRPYQEFTNPTTIATTIQANIRGPTVNNIIPSGPHFQHSSHARLPGTPSERKIQASLISPGLTSTPSEWSRRNAALPNGTPRPSQNPLLSLSHPRYGLPSSLVNNFFSLGISSIYPWQSACLLGHGLLTGEKNLVYTAPTGGGKSLVADVLMLKNVIENPGKKAILVLPYVALVQEKLAWLRRAVDGVAKNISSQDLQWKKTSRWQAQSPELIHVAGFFGGSKSTVSWRDVDIAICTIEKANSLVNAAIEECTVDSLGIIVIDELHMIDDDHRGYLMELVATKLMTLQIGVQIIGMSATLANVEVLAQWLHAKFYQSKYRPIPIDEHLVYDNAIYPAGSSKAFFKTVSQLKLNSTEPQNSQDSLLPERTIAASDFPELKRPVTNAVVALAVETALSGYGALLFCSGRQICQNISELVARAMPDEQMSQEILDHRRDVISDLRSLPVGLDVVLQKTVMNGVAFHHAGLTVEEREIVATAYDKGYLKVMVATCSLAAGINLPARRVILHGARMGRDLVGPAMLRQMRGRAGRKGKDEVGETYLCCQREDLEDVVELMEAELPPLKSCLVPEKPGLKRALLEAIGTKLATSADAIEEYMACTLTRWTSENADKLLAEVKTTLQELVSQNLIVSSENEFYEPTLLGQAIVGSSLAPEDGIFVHEELLRAQRSFVLDGEFHIFYLFTPIQSDDFSAINWQIFRNEMERLDDSGMRVLGAISINPAFVNRMVQSGATLKSDTSATLNTVRIYRRCYSAFQLRDLCNEIPIHKVAQKYDMPRGHVQTLAQTCNGFAAGMIRFCRIMGWGMLSAILDHMSDRLKAGAKADLLDMVKVTFVKSRTARVLWENGFKSVAALAAADPKDLVPVLVLAQGRKLRLEGEDEERLKQKLQAKAEVIVESANKVWEQQQMIEIEE